jgi:Protein of unknown function (DUF3300)
MQHSLIRGIAAAVALTLTSPVALHAQYAPPPPSPDQSALPPQGAPIYDQAQLDQLLAPIALYPDQLLGQILIASTYPLEVVEAARWLQDPNNAALKGDALAAALEQRDWDPSVKSLVPFPAVIQMMNDRLEWTQKLGDAFLAQQAQVMDSVQRLRHEAANAGRLQSTPQQVVTAEGPDIVIQPTDPNVVYVPYYDPTVAYGGWPYPNYPPYYFEPPPGYVYGPLVAGIGFGVGYGVFGPFWGWDDFDWGHHRVHIDRDRFNEMDREHQVRFHREGIAGDTWQHDPEHRRGVTYHDPVSQQRYTRANINPQDLNRANPGSTYQRGIISNGQGGNTNQPQTERRLQGTPPQGNIAPGNTQQGPTVLRGGNTPHPPPPGPQGVPQGADPRLHGQVGNQTIVPQGHPVTPQVQPHPVTPPPPPNRGGPVQERQVPGGG